VAARSPVAYAQLLPGQLFADLLDGRLRDYVDDLAGPG
jgi:hypothetical protein